MGNLKIRELFPQDAALRVPEEELFCFWFQNGTDYQQKPKDKSRNKTRKKMKI